MSIRLLTASKEKPLHAVLAGIGIFFLFPLIQTLATPLAFEIWLRTLADRPLNGVLYGIFSSLFGMMVALYLYTRNKCIDCSKKDVSSGLVGTTLGFVLGVCPACFSFIGLLLPLGASLVLTAYAPAFTVLSIAVLSFSIYRLKGFKPSP